MLFFYECKSTSHFLNISVVLAVCSNHKLSTESWLETTCSCGLLTVVFIAGPFSWVYSLGDSQCQNLLSEKSSIFLSGACMLTANRLGADKGRGCCGDKWERNKGTLTHGWWSLNPYLYLHLPEIPVSWGALQCKLSFHEFSSMTI